MKKQSILKEFAGLTLTQQREIYKQLEVLLYSKNRYLPFRQDIIEANGKRMCQHCGSEHIMKFGTHNGQQRYRCKACNRTSNDLTGTCISGIKKKQQWERFIQLLINGNTVREIAKELNVAVNTALYWRHKVLASLETIFTKQFKGIVEVDDVFFKFNQKGRRRKFIHLGKRKRGASDQQMSVMFTVDRYGVFDMKVVKLGRINSNSLNRVYGYNNRLNKENIICSDRHPTLSKYFKNRHFRHKQIYSRKKQYVVGEYHVNNLNNLVSRVRRWMKNYRGVSSKYLQNYLHLFMMLEVLKNDKYKVDGLLKYSLKDDTAVKKYRNIEQNYQYLLLPV